MKNWRKLLWPLVPFYYIGSFINKLLYDFNLKKSSEFSFPVITVGNISAGGTGKSPFVLYLVDLFKSNYNVAVLSRGYGRKSKGFHWVTPSSSYTQVGDEPLQLKITYPQVTVAVDADRKNGIDIIQNENKSDIIVLDDAFQHRRVKGKFQILLTAYYNLYSDDFPLPAGDLREPMSAYKRANVIVVTKCPDTLSLEDQVSIKNQLKVKDYQSLFFTKIKYSSNVVSINSNVPLIDFIKTNFTLITGIAEPKPMIDYLNKLGANYTHLNYPDHYSFNDEDFNSFESLDLILTTQKDYMRLKDYENIQHKLFYLPISISFLEGEDRFKELLFGSL